MVRVITIDDIRNLIRKITFATFIERLVEKLEDCFSRWEEFAKISRVAAHFDELGVIELMPCWGKDYYAFKYVNGHPLNPQDNKLTVTAVGMLADIETGYPSLVSEMTLLTALRTAATSALVAKYTARSDSKTFAMVGTGAQSEFQVLAHKVLFDLENVRYFDPDEKAMAKFADNLKSQGLNLTACASIEEALDGADMITTATAIKKHNPVIKNDWIQPGMMINGLGGDCPGKTEMEPELLERAKVVVEYTKQTIVEGEVQNRGAEHIYAEVWELVSGKKLGRSDRNEIFLFDSVGFALEDYAVLHLVYGLAEDYHIGHMLDLTPEDIDPKNLYGLLR